MNEDLTGKRFTRWLVIEKVNIKPDRYLCRCDCGTEKIRNKFVILDKRSRSCGCLRGEGLGVINKNRATHGKFGTPEYKVWSAMIQRCYNLKYASYSRYGGRGIKVCEEWRNDFQAFYDDMGDKPSKKHSIGRIDNDGNYCKENCRWETSKEQANNRSNNTLISFNGKTKNIGEWASELNINIDTLCRRIYKLNWSLEKSLTTPVILMKDRIRSKGGYFES